MKLAVIRIKGQIGLKKEVKETLYRLRLRKKYSCVVFILFTFFKVDFVNWSFL